MSNVYTVPQNNKTHAEIAQQAEQSLSLPLPQEAIDMGSIPVFGLFSRATKRQTYFPLPLTQTELF